MRILVVPCNRSATWNISTITFALSTCVSMGRWSQFKESCGPILSVRDWALALDGKK
jgi:hypothetical protein